MSEKKPESFIRGMVESPVKNDVEKTLSLFTEDAVWVAPEGTFKGKEKLKRYITWSIQVVPNKKFRDTGIGIIVGGIRLFGSIS